MRCSKTVPCDACVGQGMALQCRREQVIVTKHIRSVKVQQQKAKGAATGTTNPAGPSLGRIPPVLQYPEPRQASPDHEETAAVLLDLSQHQSHQPHHSHDLNLGYVFDIGRPGPSTLGHTSRRHEEVSSPTSSSYRLGSQQWTVPSDCDEAARVSSPDTEVSPFEATVTSLEFMVWGRQRDGGVPAPAAMPHVQDDADGAIISPQQAAEIIKYHWRWLTWTHNMIHWPQFQEECHLYWNDGIVKENAWVALYYAVLCVGLHHMTMDQRTELGLATVHSREDFRLFVGIKPRLIFMTLVVSVQAICLLVLCAHDFNGSNLLAVLLSSAIRIAQSLNVHRLGPDPVELPYRDKVQREIRKSIWMFLSTQDSFMIPFSNSHSISLNYCNTPAPLNCNAISGAGANGRSDPFKPVSIEQPTAMSYQLIMHKVAHVYRSFFDQTSSLPGTLDSDAAMRRLYDHVLKADSEISNILKALPRYLRVDYTETNIRLPCYIPRQRYHFAISVAHKTLSIHRKFFLRSLTDKWYNYTKVLMSKPEYGRNF
ncbi:hypothetical protein GQ53DRAFT_837902 [Thozetella sp. PMI_491]|nr:hypothetical protein GQ53DRAFT_837902 [Thozetella sp. PMI_491]